MEVQMCEGVSAAFLETPKVSNDLYTYKRNLVEHTFPWSVERWGNEDKQSDMYTFLHVLCGNSHILENWNPCH